MILVYKIRIEKFLKMSKRCKLCGMAINLWNTVMPLCYTYTHKKENKIFLIYREIQSGAVAKSYMRKGFLIYEEMRKYFPNYEEAVSHI